MQKNANLVDLENATKCVVSRYRRCPHSQERARERGHTSRERVRTELERELERKLEQNVEQKVRTQQEHCCFPLGN